MDYAAGGRKNLPAYGGNLGDFGNHVVQSRRDLTNLGNQ
jgi:hypothetical protein